MKVTADRREFLSAALDAERIAPAQSPVELLRCTYLHAEDGKLTVAAGNLEYAMERRIVCHTEKRGSTVINARMLSDMLRLMDGDTVELQTNDKHCALIRCGTAQYLIPLLSAEEYPRMELPCPEDTVPVSGIPKMVKRTVFAVSEEEGKPLMKCVHLVFSSDGLKAVSSDGYRIAAAKGETRAAASASFLLPAGSLEKLAFLVNDRDTLRVGLAGHTVVFMKEDFLFSARIVEGTYFNSDQLFQMAKPAFTVLTDAKAVLETVNSATAVMGTRNRFCLAFGENRLRSRCESENGSSSGALDVVALNGVPRGTYWYNPQMLLECLKAQSGTMMLEVAQNGALIMKTDDLICMQLALREPAPIVLKKPRSAAAEKAA